jgi:hypothetical protein
MTNPPAPISGNGLGGSLKLICPVSIACRGGTCLERVHDRSVFSSCAHERTEAESEHQPTRHACCECLARRDDERAGEGE